jgi:AcrR family transcriptional regulator
MARRRLAPDERRRELLAQGLLAFSRRPYEEVTVAEIAEAAGASEGLVFRYFGDKRSFYVEAIRAALAMAQEASDPGPGLPPRERFEQGLRSFVDLVSRFPYAVPHVLLGGPAAEPGLREEIETAREAVAKRVIERMGVADPGPRLRWAVRAWMLFVQDSTTTWLERPEISREELLEIQIVSFRAVAANALGVDPVPSEPGSPPPLLP